MSGLLASIAEVALAVPIGFATGVAVGLAAASRWRIVRRQEPEREPGPWRDHSGDRG